MAAATHPTAPDATTTLLASFHLLRYPAGAPAREAFSRMGLDRPELLATPGLRFFRLLGTGAGERMTLSADLRRWALLAFWQDAASLDRFLDASPVPARWDALGAERYDLRLAVARAHGSWGRATFDVDRAAPLRPDAPVAILTRAAIRPQRLHRFWPSVRAPALDLSAHPSHLASVGIGDLPLVRQATFSLWDSLDGARDFAYHRAAHRTVIQRTRTEGWYSSELFARFVPLASTGTWGGKDPLAGRI
ncbi:MAG: hypothetical protein AAGC46_19950 [Solirubrobacteraceae bacterium]|nr:hypothetical protein [Patulibacter sp.]